MQNTKKEDYNKEPVVFCSRCLSLNIKRIGANDFCDDCGSTHMDEANISIWQKMYAEIYGEENVIKEK